MRNTRKTSDLRKFEIIPNFSSYPEGSCMIKFGETHVLCNASLDQNVPRWLKNSQQGWVTAEYGMLPRSTSERMSREAVRGKQSGRTQEIQRLIGRSLRAVTDLSLLIDMQILFDCDVIQADGGTRTASISGAFVALQLCIQSMIGKKIIKTNPIKENLAAISCGIVDNVPLLDLDFIEDQNAEVDANFVITETNKIVEIQMTSEKKLCTENEFNSMFELAKSGISQIIQSQKILLEGK